MTPHVVVVGSANLDLVFEATRLPAEGETTIGSTYREFPGGKGLNQSVAAVVLAPTTLVCALGSDGAGESLARVLDSAGVAFHGPPNQGTTGRALVLLSKSDNRIVVVPGANDALKPSDVVESLDALDPSVVVSVLEVPPAAIAEAARWCVAHGRRFIVNASPVDSFGHAEIPELLSVADPVIVNRGEALALLGLPHSTPTSDLAVAMASLAQSAIVTDGAGGCHLASDGVSSAVSSPRVQVRDTTGAGDAFAGTLAAALAIGSDLEAAAVIASRAAARIVATDRSSRVGSRNGASGTLAKTREG